MKLYGKPGEAEEDVLDQEYRDESRQSLQQQQQQKQEKVKLTWPWSSALHRLVSWARDNNAWDDP